MSKQYNSFPHAFNRKIIKSLPQKWVISFEVYKALEVLGIDELVDMAPLETIHKQNIIKACIKYMLPEEIFHEYYYFGENNPKSILCIMFDRYKISITKELLELTLSHQCLNPISILTFFWKDKEVKKWKKEVINRFSNFWQSTLKKRTDIFDALYENKNFNDPEILYLLSKSNINENYLKQN